MDVQAAPSSVEVLQAAPSVNDLGEHPLAATELFQVSHGCGVLFPIDHVTVKSAAPGGLLASDVGTGKTAIMLHAAVSSIRAGPTLIVVPNSLEAQWLCELKRMYGRLVHDDPATFTSPTPNEAHINVWRCTTLAAYWKGARAPWNLVLTTYDFIAARVKELLAGQEKDQRGSHAPSDNGWPGFVASAPDFCRQHNLPCCFADIQWHRIVYDEIMDGLAKHSKHMWAFLNALKVRHVWVLSATPGKFGALAEILRLTYTATSPSLNGKRPKDLTPFMNELGVDLWYSVIYPRTFRVTKDETKKHVQPTRIEAQIVPLTLTTDERMIMHYVSMQSGQGHNNALICTDVASFLQELVKASEKGSKAVVCTVDMFWERMKYENSAQGTELQAELQARKARLEELRSVRDALPADAAAECAVVTTELKKMEREFTAIEARLSKVAVNQSFLDNLNERIEDAKVNPCPICVDDIGPDQMAITVCGHVFCIDCITSWLGPHSSCPACRRTPLDLGQVTVVYTQIADQATPEKAQAVYSTKLDFLLTHLRNVFQTTTDKVIVFCNYSSTLKKLFDVLESEHISCARMTGNVHGKGAALIKFKYGKTSAGQGEASLEQCRVMLLNTTSQASGMDLIEANRIVFVDSNLSLETLTQAYGRCARLGQTKKIMLTFLTIPEFEDVSTVTNFVGRLTESQACDGQA